MFYFETKFCMVYVNALFLKDNTIQEWSNYHAICMKIQNQYNFRLECQKRMSVAGRKRF